MWAIFWGRFVRNDVPGGDDADARPHSTLSCIRTTASVSDARDDVGIVPYKVAIGYRRAVPWFRRVFHKETVARCPD